MLYIIRKGNKFIVYNKHTDNQSTRQEDPASYVFTDTNGKKRKVPTNVNVYSSPIGSRKSKTPKVRASRKARTPKVRASRKARTPKVKASRKSSFCSSNFDYEKSPSSSFTDDDESSESSSSEEE